MTKQEIVEKTMEATKLGSTLTGGFWGVFHGSPVEFTLIDKKKSLFGPLASFLVSPNTEDSFFLTTNFSNLSQALNLKPSFVCGFQNSFDNINSKEFSDKTDKINSQLYLEGVAQGLWVRYKLIQLNQIDPDELCANYFK